MPDPTKGDVYVAQAEAAAKLSVTSDGPEVLVVDAKALMRDVNDVRYWRLCEDQPGMWLHPQSGTDPGPLSEVLRAIASCYLAESPSRKRRAVAGGDDPEPPVCDPEAPEATDG